MWRLLKLMIVAGLGLAAGTVGLVGCGPSGPRAWGEAVDPAVAVPLSRAISADGAVGEMVTVSGRIGEVCSTAGCWFVLQDTSGERLSEVLVDLKPGADFTVPPDVRGKDAVVRGRLVGEKPDLKLHAVGLVLE